MDLVATYRKEQVIVLTWLAHGMVQVENSAGRKFKVRLDELGVV